MQTVQLKLTKIDEHNSYRVNDLKECILAALNTSVGFIESQGFYKSMETKFKGLSAMESIQEAIKRMNIILINEKKTLWPLGNQEETFEAIGRTIQLPKRTRGNDPCNKKQNC